MTDEGPALVVVAVASDTGRGENLLGLSAGTVLRLGATAAVCVTGLRNPCRRIDGFQSGLFDDLVRHHRGLPSAKTPALGVPTLVTSPTAYTSGYAGHAAPARKARTG